MRKKIDMNYITKIEGHASLYLDISDGKVKECNLKSVEGARFFEGIVKGKHYTEIPEITSRICGICSCAHTITSIKAIENAFNIQVSEQTKLLRELLTIGERIRSHTTHLYFLVLPDYLGYESGIVMAKKHKKEVNRALELMKLGNNLIQVVGGRVMHPVTFEIGYCTYLPKKDELDDLLKRLKLHKRDAIKTAELFSSIDTPLFERETEYVSLKQLDGFPLISGDIISTKGLNIKANQYKKFFKEFIVPYSTAKFAVRDGKAYFTGALARVNTNQRLLCKEAENMIKKSRKKFPSHNPFYNNFAQSLELIHWIDRAIEIIEKWDFKKEYPQEIKPKAEQGIAVTEAPRGLLFHDYIFDKKGIVKKCNIITPTAQFLNNLEKDIREYVSKNLIDKSEKELKLEIEKLIRAYDPCFSCSTHFLDLKIKK
jgi:sulfhydrogenase subunit alpha